ncbi:MAG: hypothetical protein L0Y79_06605 [Chlorobi bacterium]|nr:hypothetical protein [Chlorobiota bacterium]MCI0715394.1 hypothetical protein [Chlorobiota bacterium]
MKTLIITLIITLTLFLGLQLFSQVQQINKLTLSGNLGSKSNLVIEDKIEKLTISSNLSLTSNSYSFEPTKLVNENFLTAKSNLQQEKKKTKSVGLGILLSAILPGAGEFYGEDYLKAGIFIGVELLAWGTYIYFETKGDNKTEEYQSFADANWDVRQYAQWLVDQNFEGAGGVNPNEPNLEILRQQINECESQNFSHTLPELRSQQYYELIGKYQNFVAGWKDARSGNTWLITNSNYFTYQTAMFKSYAVDRQDANDLYDYAKIGPITAILNHILSAADAAWTISTYNKNIKVETGFRMGNFRSPYTYKIEQMPTFNVSVSF